MSHVAYEKGMSHMKEVLHMNEHVTHEGGSTWVLDFHPRGYVTYE